MFEIGKINSLTVDHIDPEAYYLRNDNDSSREEFVILIKRNCQKEYQVGDLIEVFIFKEDQDLLASDSRPLACLDEFACLKVVETKAFGAFLKWGIHKDLFIPTTEQREPLREDEYYIVKVCKDDRTQKIFATTKINKFIQSFEHPYNEGDTVSFIPVLREDLGFRCIINHSSIGMIYYNEIYETIEIGKEISGVVKKIREDGLVDLSLQPKGFKNLVNATDKIMSLLEQNQGKLALHDKSSPEEISQLLQMSKKSFKRAIGMLYKQKRIIIKEKSIEKKYN